MYHVSITQVELIASRNWNVLTFGYDNKRMINDVQRLETHKVSGASCVVIYLIIFR